MPNPTPFIEFARDPDAIILLKSLAAGMGIDSETRGQIADHFRGRLVEEEARTTHDPRQERADFASRIQPDGSLSSRNPMIASRAFGITAAALAGQQAVQHIQQGRGDIPIQRTLGKTLIGAARTERDAINAAQSSRDVLVGLKKEMFIHADINSATLQAEIDSLGIDITDLDDSLQSEFMQKAERNITKGAINKKVAHIDDLEFMKKAVSDLNDPKIINKSIRKSLPLPDRIRVNLIDALDRVIEFQSNLASPARKKLVAEVVDGMIVRAKMAAKVAGRVGGPAAIVLGARGFQEEMKKLQEQKRRQLEGLEPAGLQGDPIGP